MLMYTTNALVTPAAKRQLIRHLRLRSLRRVEATSPQCASSLLLSQTLS